MPDIAAGRRTILGSLAGGGVWLGGVVAAIAVFLWLVRRSRIASGSAINAAFVAVPFGHAVGRIGCLLGGCCYGSACSWLKLKSLDPAIPYVVCCENGRRSSAAAYLLSERGFDASVLRGGIAVTDLAEALNAVG